MQAFVRKQITGTVEINEYRMSNKVYPPSAAPEATREFRITKFDGLVRSQKTPFSVIPAEAGIQEYQELLDPGACPGPRSGIRLGDGLKDFLREHQV